MLGTNSDQDHPTHTPPYSESQQTPSAWPELLAGAALFLVAGLDLIASEIPYEWAVPEWFPFLRYTLFLGFMLFPVVGFGIGWVKSFPRWSYPYVGHVLLVSLYMMNVATPGLRVFHYTFGSDDLWGWRAWIPFLVMAAIALALTRSAQPILRFFSNAWEDWTLLTFGMFGFMPLLIALNFDEADRLYSLPFMVGLTLVMIGTAVAYLHSTRQSQRALVLLTNISLITAVATVGVIDYWMKNGWVDVQGSIVVGIIVVAVMLSPALLGLVHRSIRSLQAP
jgi:hypothetical protein